MAVAVVENGQSGLDWSPDATRRVTANSDGTARVVFSFDPRCQGLRGSQK